MNAIKCLVSVIAVASLLTSCNKEIEDPNPNNQTEVVFEFKNDPQTKVIGGKPEYDNTMEGSYINKLTHGTVTFYQFMVTDLPNNTVLEFLLPSNNLEAGTYTLSYSDQYYVYLNYHGTDYTLLPDNPSEFKINILSVQDGVVNAAFSGKLADLNTSTVYNLVNGRFTNVKIIP